MWVQNQKQRLHRFSRFCTDDHRLSLYFRMGRPLPPNNCPFPWGDLDRHLTHGFLGPPESSTKTGSRSVQPFLQGSLAWQTDRQETGHATRSVTIGRIYIHSSAMWPNNYKLHNHSFYYDLRKHFSQLVLLISGSQQQPQPFYGPLSGTNRVRISLPDETLDLCACECEFQSFAVDKLRQRRQNLCDSSR